MRLANYYFEKSFSWFNRPSIEPEYFGAINTCPAGNPGACLEMPDDCSSEDFLPFMNDFCFSNSFHPLHLFHGFPCLANARIT
jgi:hypothetical protein